jgi:hypothetical protein
MLVAAGDGGSAAHRFGDLWSAIVQQQPVAATWTCLTDAAGSSFTPRSNAAAAVSGDWLLLFGGWSVTGVQQHALLPSLAAVART